MKNKNMKLEIKKDQLLELKQFRWYCDNRSLEFDDEFYDALIKEGFLNPVLVDEKLGPLFSRLQYPIVAFFRLNTIKDGRLFHPDARATTADREPIRGMSFLGFQRYTYEYDDFSDARVIVGALDKIVRFIHCLDVLYDPDDERWEHMSRGMADSGELLFEYKGLDKSAVLTFMNLEEADYDYLRLIMAFYLRDFDPLWEWFYYIDRHPRHVREQMKGDALIAQEFIFVDYVLKDLGRFLFGEQEDIKSLSIKDWKGNSLKDDEFLHGTDYKAIMQTFDSFLEWTRQEEANDYVDADFTKKLHSLREEMLLLGTKMGAVNGSNVETPYDSPFYWSKMAEDLTLKDLPEKYRVTGVTKQDGTSDTKPAELSLALRAYVRSLQLEVINMVNSIARMISMELSDIRHRLSAGLYIKDKGQETLEVDMADRIKIRNMLYVFVKDMQRVLCQRCRENPVKVFDRNNQSQGVICEACLKNAKTLALSKKSKDAKRFGEDREACLFCDKCRKRLLCKSANRNVLIFEGRGDRQVVTVNYGSVQVEVRCHGKDEKGRTCGYLNKKRFDFGWLK